MTIYEICIHVEFIIYKHRIKFILFFLLASTCFIIYLQIKKTFFEILIYKVGLQETFRHKFLHTLIIVNPLKSLISKHILEYKPINFTFKIQIHLNKII